MKLPLVLELAGLALVVAGVTLVFVPAGLVVAGAGLIAVAYWMEGPHADPARGPRPPRRTP